MKFIRCILLLIIGTNVVAFGQSRDTLTYPYKITGVIRDNKGNPLGGANVISPGDANFQTSDNEGKYFAIIYHQKTPVTFTFYKYISVLYCPDGRTKVDMVLNPENSSGLKRFGRRIGHLFQSKKKRRISCP